jgi:hypothetical protein
MSETGLWTGAPGQEKPSKIEFALISTQFSETKIKLPPLKDVSE